MSKKRGVLFICLGNICRSPIAEAVFSHLVAQRGLSDIWFTDSAGTGNWHCGHRPDPRALSVLERHGIDTNHRARQICDEDFTRFEYILGMDSNNISDINEVKPKDSQSVVELLGKYDPKGETTIEDPYYQRGDKGFQTNYEQCLRSCNAFLDQFK